MRPTGDTCVLTGRVTDVEPHGLVVQILGQSLHLRDMKGKVGDRVTATVGVYAIPEPSRPKLSQRGAPRKPGP